MSRRNVPLAVAAFLSAALAADAGSAETRWTPDSCKPETALGHLFCTGPAAVVGLTSSADQVYRFASDPSGASGTVHSLMQGARPFEATHRLSTPEFVSTAVDQNLRAEISVADLADMKVLLAPRFANRRQRDLESWHMVGGVLGDGRRVIATARRSTKAPVVFLTVTGGGTDAGAAMSQHRRFVSAFRVDIKIGPGFP
jgi:hypothetical protein